MNPNILLITIYPPKDSIHGKKVGGVASYAKNTVLSTEKSFNYIILAQHNDEGENEYNEGPHKIIRCWRADTIGYLISLISQLIRRRKESSRLMIQFEFGIFGNEFKTGFFPILLIAARLLGYKITLVQHQVVANLGELKEHLGIRGVKKFIYSFLMRKFISFMTILPNQIIVFDQIHKDKLIQIREKVSEKVNVIPHGVEKLDQSNNHDTQWYDKTIGTDDSIKILLFGFIANYKGSLVTVTQFNKYFQNNPETKFKLFLAGGESPTQKDGVAYKEYYTKTTQIASNNSRIVHTGFVPEDQIDLVHQRADLILLPYQALMSSSGPLSFAIKHQKPFLLSDVLQPYTLTEDFNIAIEKNLGSGGEYPILKLQNGNIFEQVDGILKNPILMDNLTGISEDLYQSRQWSQIGELYIDILR